MKDSTCKDCPYIDEIYVPPLLVEDSDILFVGQNPGATEQKSGIPSHPKGASGALLKKYTDTLPVKFSITNALKCGTPNKKAPTTKEINRCKHRLIEEIKQLKPKLIVTLGKPAMVAVTGENSPILKSNGKIFRGEGIPVLVCVHPSFVVRGKDEKIFEKGILPALKYFEENAVIDFKVLDTIPATDIEVGFDIETSSLRPQLGEIKCFSVSDGNKAVFVEVEE